MAGFYISGSTANSAPRTMIVPISETCYVGQFVQWDYGNAAGGTGGAVQIADVATELHEDDEPVAGVVLAVYNAGRSYDSTYYGDKCTYSTTQSDIASLTNGYPQVVLGLAIPDITIFRGPIFNAAFGTALTEQVVTSASSGGVTITATGDAVTDIADDFCVAYCRAGANRGQYRIVTTSTSTTVNTVTVPFSNGIVVGDVFVIASVRPGMGGLDWPATANCIDGNNDMDTAYTVIYHKINLEESGKEYAEFTFTSAATGTET